MDGLVEIQIDIGAVGPCVLVPWFFQCSVSSLYEIFPAAINQR